MSITINVISSSDKPRSLRINESELEASETQIYAKILKEFSLSSTSLFYFIDDEGDNCAVSREPEMREACRMALRSKSRTVNLLLSTGGKPDMSMLIKANQLTSNEIEDEGVLVGGPELKKVQSKASEEDGFTLVSSPPSPVMSPVTPTPAAPSPSAVAFYDQQSDAKSDLPPVAAVAVAAPVPAVDQPAPSAVPVAATINAMVDSVVAAAEQKSEQIAAPTPAPLAVASPSLAVSPSTPQSRPMPSQPSPQLQPLSSPSQTLTFSLGERVLLAGEGLQCLTGIVTSVDGRTLTIVLEPESAENSTTSSSSSSAAAESKGGAGPSAPAVPERKRSESKDAALVPGRAASPSVFENFKRAIVLEARSIREDMRKTSLKKFWAEFVKEMKAAFNDIGKMFEGKPAPAVPRRESKEIKMLPPPQVEGVPSSQAQANAAPSPSAAEKADKADSKSGAPTPPKAAAPAPAPVASAAAKPEANYDLQLAMLTEMGYTDTQMLTDLLSFAKGNLELVVTWLSAANPRAQGSAHAAASSIVRR